MRKILSIETILIANTRREDNNNEKRTSDKASACVRAKTENGVFEQECSWRVGLIQSDNINIAQISK